MGTVAKIAAVKFGEEQMPRYFLLGDLELRKGDCCVVQGEKGEVVGAVALVEYHTCPVEGVCGHFPRILRQATEEEVARWRKRREREREAIAVCKRKVEEHGLPMKISTVLVDESQNKIIFHFTADKRVDFRALVRDLASRLRARIELWQIGVRDEAKLIDGFGVCGKRLCCSGYFRDFKPISLKMAKSQDIALAPSKLSGCCGRLMCCLAFEEATYSEMAQGVPPIGAVVRTDQYEGIVVDRNILRRTVQVMERDEVTHTVPVSAILEVRESRDRKGRKVRRLQDIEQEAEAQEEAPVAVLADDEAAIPESPAENIAAAEADSPADTGNDSTASQS